MFLSILLSVVLTIISQWVDGVGYDLEIGRGRWQQVIRIVEDNTFEYPHLQVKYHRLSSHTTKHTSYNPMAPNQSLPKAIA